jgi:predicted DNA-binding protein
MTRKTVNVAYGQVCIRISQELVDKADTLVERLAMLDGLQRSVSRSDVLREAIRRGLAELEQTLPKADRLPDNQSCPHSFNPVGVPCLNNTCKVCDRWR